MNRCDKFWRREAEYIGATGFASIEFGYPNALWGEPQTPVIWQAQQNLLK